MNQWQPIKSAPLNTKLLVCRFNGWSAPVIEFGLLRVYFDIGDDKPRWSLNNKRVKSDSDNPTHWVRLPAPPEVKADD
jgi:hypothetical protein